jgi:hypothetical protein
MLTYVVVSTYDNIDVLGSTYGQYMCYINVTSKKMLH